MINCSHIADYETPAPEGFFEMLDILGDMSPISMFDFLQQPPTGKTQCCLYHASFHFLHMYLITMMNVSFCYYVLFAEATNALDSIYTGYLSLSASVTGFNSVMKNLQDDTQLRIQENREAQRGAAVAMEGQKAAEHRLQELNAAVEKRRAEELELDKAIAAKKSELAMMQGNFDVKTRDYVDMQAQLGNLQQQYQELLGKLGKLRQQYQVEDGKLLDMQQQSEVTGRNLGLIEQEYQDMQGKLRDINMEYQARVADLKGIMEQMAEEPPPPCSQVDGGEEEQVQEGS